MAANNTPSTPSRTATFVILCVGTIAAIACAFGPAWMTRIGVAVALLTAFASVLTTWRQMDRMVVEHMAALKAVQDAAREELRQAAHAHHVESMAMIERFNKRKEGFAAELAAAQAEIAELRGSVTTAELEAETKQTRISALNKIVSELERQIESTDGELAKAEGVIEMPRRGASRRSLAGLDMSGLPLVYPTQERRQA